MCHPLPTQSDHCHNLLPLNEARVEHPFHVVKNIFKYKKTRYKGLAKNDAQLNVLFALSNLYMAREKLRP